MNRLDEDEHTPKDKDKDIPKIKTKTNTKDMDKTIPKTKDMDNTIPKTEDKDNNTPKTKTEDKDMLDKINNKISIINETCTILAEIKIKVKKKIKLIYESMYELQDETFSDDSWLRLVELNKIGTIIDYAINVIWNMIRKKKKKK